MEEIVKMAQQVATNIAKNQTEPIDPKNMDMGKMISQVTDSVSKMITPDLIEKMTNNEQSTVLDNSNNNGKSKIKFNDNKKKSSESSIKELEELEELDNDIKPLNPRTKDLNFTLNVTLEELYLGKVKKLAVRRKRIVTDGKKKNLVEEKKKIAVNIEPGMFDEQVITFNKQADEKEGYETGDIVITLCCAENEEYEREGNNLLIEKEISLYEAFNCLMTITHLDGREINIRSPPINIFGDELDCYRKLRGFGMPIYGKDNEYGDLIIKFKPIITHNLTTEHLEILKDIFPRINIIKELSEDKEYELELATESDFEYSDNEDNESDYTDSEDESDLDEDDSTKVEED